MNVQFLLAIAFLGLAEGASLTRTANGTSVSSISLSTAVPSDASAPVNRSFAAFAFEESSFYFYFGTPEKPNNFSLKLLGEIIAKTKTQPDIRVGGTSLDNSKYDPDQKQAIKIPKSQQGHGIPKNLTVGPSYFGAFATIPNASYVVDIPMRRDNLSNSELFAKDAYDKIGKDKITSFEIGNEPNNYPESVAAYVKQWKNWSATILTTLDLSPDTKIYQAIALSSEDKNDFPGGGPGDPKVPSYFKAGLTSVESRIKTVSMHYYQTKANPHSDLQTDIMNHTAVTKGTKFVKHAVDFLHNQSIPLVLGEVGSILGNASNNQALAGVLGSALWQADFFLYNMFLEVEKINLQSGLTFSFALWNPEFTVNNKTTPAAVHPAFYGQIFSAEFRGDADTVQVYNYDMQSPFLSAYAAYDNGKLARVALINLELWSSDEQEPRPNKTISLDVGQGVKSVTVKKLTSLNGGTAPASNITWGGMQWTAESGGRGVQVLNDTASLPIDAGKVSIIVPASEALMLSMIY